MSVSVHRRPAAVLAVAALLTAGLAAPASASPWTDAWSRLSGWFSFGALWAADEAMPGGDGETTAGNRGSGAHAIWQNDGALIPPVGRPSDIQSEAGILVDPNGVPRP